MKLLGFDFGNVVPKKEEPLFEIFQDGEGFYSAQHIHGNMLGTWLWSCGGVYEFMDYKNRKRFDSLEGVNKACEAYIKQNETKHIGSIKFIRD